MAMSSTPEPIPSMPMIPGDKVWLPYLFQFQHDEFTGGILYINPYVEDHA